VSEPSKRGLGFMLSMLPASLLLLLTFVGLGLSLLGLRA
jgi:hypothetical protein